MTPAELAEDFFAHVVAARLERDRSPRACLSLLPGPTPFFASVAAVRAETPEDLAALTRHAAAWFAERGRADCFWFLTPSTTPANAAEHLRSLGLVEVGHGTAMTMLSPPPPIPEGVEIREVTDKNALLTYRLLTLEAGGTEPITEAQRAATVADHDQAWADALAVGRQRRFYLAYVDGEPLAAGGLMFSGADAVFLSGAGTARGARGRGLYRALVRFRWDVAVAEGIPAMVILASDDSAPILAGLGFSKVADTTLMRQVF